MLESGEGNNNPVGIDAVLDFWDEFLFGPGHKYKLHQIDWTHMFQWNLTDVFSCLKCGVDILSWVVFPLSLYLKLLMYLDFCSIIKCSWFIIHFIFRDHGIWLLSLLFKFHMQVLLVQHMFQWLKFGHQISQPSYQAFIVLSCFACTDGKCMHWTQVEILNASLL